MKKASEKGARIAVKYIAHFFSACYNLAERDPKGHASEDDNDGCEANGTVAARIEKEFF